MVNIKDVAKLAQVSPMTVSRVINNGENISAKTKLKVKEAIDRLKYMPNQLAQGLVKSSSKTIGVLFSNVFNQVYSSIIVGIEQRAKEFGYNIMISNSTDYKSAVSGLNMLISKMVDGLIILPFEPSGMNEDNLREHAVAQMWEFYGYLKQILEVRKTPSVIIDIDIDSDAVNYVLHDYEGSIRTGMQYLIDSGFKNIHYLSSVLKQGLWSDRENVYLQMMQDSGNGENSHVDYCENSTVSAHKLVSSILAAGVRPQVFYCANDIIAIGAIQAISAFGLNVPRDISVMGNDGIDIGQMLVPPLTSVSINSQTLGRKCVDVCISSILGEEIPSVSMIDSFLMERKSTAKPT